MIISPSRNFVFVHVPKCAGISIEDALCPHLDMARDVVLHGKQRVFGHAPLIENQQDITLRLHSSAGQARRVIGLRDWRRMFSFAFVRNPFLRALSCYNFIQHQRTAIDVADGPRAKYHRFGSYNFDEICADLEYWVGEIGMLSPQVKWVHAPPLVSFVGRVERLGSDMEHVFAHLGLPLPDTGWPHSNAVPRIATLGDISGASVDRLRAFYALDFDTFDYVIDPEQAG